VKRDIEETEDVLDAESQQPLKFWEDKQRELVTSVVDYNLKTLSELITGESIKLHPRFQRRFRWDRQRQSRLIESFLMNVPVPPIYLNEDEYGEYSVIDGKQRLTAIHEFFRGRLELNGLVVFSDINTCTFDTLPRELRNVLETRPTLRAVILLRQSDADVKYEVFQRLNTGGVRLNPQEIRNSTWPGPLNDRILDLSEHNEFHALLGIRVKTKSAVYQEMRDAEFVLRYFTFKDNWATFKGGMKRQLDDFMRTHQRADRELLDSLTSDFLRTVATVQAAFGDHAFRRWMPKANRWKKQILAALYDAQMFAAKDFAAKSFQGKKEQVLKAQTKLFEDRDFLDAIGAGTNTPTYFTKRIECTRSMLQAVAEA
jgi:hypothetical protein